MQGILQAPYAGPSLPCVVEDVVFLALSVYCDLEMDCKILQDYK